MSEKIKLRMSQAKCATHIMKNKIQRDLSSWLKLLEEVSGKHWSNSYQFIVNK